MKNGNFDLMKNGNFNLMIIPHNIHLDSLLVAKFSSATLLAVGGGQGGSGWPQLGGFLSSEAVLRASRKPLRFRIVRRFFSSV